jgi:hypothetical protein
MKELPNLHSSPRSLEWGSDELGDLGIDGHIMGNYSVRVDQCRV